MSMQEIAKELGLSIEVVRMIYSSVMEKLSNPKSMKNLQENNNLFLLPEDLESYGDYPQNYIEDYECIDGEYIGI